MTFYSFNLGINCSVCTFLQVGGFYTFFTDDKRLKISVWELWLVEFCLFQVWSPCTRSCMPMLGRIFSHSLKTCSDHIYHTYHRSISEIGTYILKHQSQRVLLHKNRLKISLLWYAIKNLHERQYSIAATQLGTVAWYGFCSFDHVHCPIKWFRIKNFLVENSPK